MGIAVFLYLDLGFVIEGPKWCAFEIKLGTNQIDEAANNLIQISIRLEKTKEALRRQFYTLYAYF